MLVSVKLSGLVVGVAPALVDMPPVMVHCIYDCED